MQTAVNISRPNITKRRTSDITLDWVWYGYAFHLSMLSSVSPLSLSSLVVLISRQWARDAVSCLSSRLFALTVLMPLRKAGRLRCALGGVFLLLWYLGVPVVVVRGVGGGLIRPGSKAPLNSHH
jgi:hypothetical protein